jgi:O-antigen/teichoic acid export membrane protein
MTENTFKRITKTGIALVGNQGLQLLGQLAVPPLFLMKYGVLGYSEWLVLTAAIGFLSVLNFGLHTYVINELNVSYHQNDLKKFHELQTTCLILLTGIAVLFTVIAGVVFVLPLKIMLNLSASEINISVTIYFLILQLLVLNVLGLINGGYRATGKAFRGVMWSNVQKLIMVLSLIAGVLLAFPFYILAIFQFAAVILSLIIVSYDRKLNFTNVSISFKYWNSAIAKNIIKPSLYFSLFTINNFLLYQAPVLILNYFVEPKLVVMFSVGRMIFSFIRQGLGLIYGAIEPEITRLKGIGDWLQLKRLYKYTESLTISIALPANVAVLMLSPLLLRLWLKNADYYNKWSYLFLMLISVAMCLKENKIYFQYATNTHERTGSVMFFSYLIMILLSIYSIKAYGINGFLFSWLITEIFQLCVILVFNTVLFNRAKDISFSPIVILGGILGGFVLVFINYYPWFYIGGDSLLIIKTIAMVPILLLTAYFFLGLKQVLMETRKRF